MCKSLKTPNRLRTKMSHRICDTEVLPFMIPSPLLNLKALIAWDGALAFVLLTILTASLRKDATLCAS